MRGILHAEYWRLHTAFLKNDRPTAERFLAMLESDIKKSSERALEAEIGEQHMRRFAKIRDRMSRGEFGRLYGDGAACPEVAPSFAPEADVTEKDFHRALVRDRKTLLRELGARDWSEMLREFDLSPYGRCDFLIREGRIWHAVEIKMGEAPPAVVSQIDRYRLALELDMNLGLHDCVMAAVMAESFPPYVAAELSRNSVTMLLHRGTPESVKKLTGV